MERTLIWLAILAVIFLLYTFVNRWENRGKERRAQERRDAPWLELLAKAVEQSNEVDENDWDGTFLRRLVADLFNWLDDASFQYLDTSIFIQEVIFPDIAERDNLAKLAEPAMKDQVAYFLHHHLVPRALEPVHRHHMALARADSYLFAG